MKKGLLLGLAIAGLSTYAQDCIDAKGFNEDFTSKDNTDGKYVIRWWGKKTPVGKDTEDKTCKGVKTCLNFTHSVTRNTNADNKKGDLELKITQAENGWTPIGFSTMDKDNKGCLDLSSSNKVSVSLTNKGKEDIEIYFSFFSDGLTGDKAKVANGTDAAKAYGQAVKAGATYTADFDISKGRLRKWINVNSADAVKKCKDDKGEVKGSYCVIDKGFKSTCVSGIEFSINGAGKSVNGKWTQPAITDHPVNIHYIKGGDLKKLAEKCKSGVKRVTYDNLKVFPNPATNVLNVAFNSTASAVVSISDLSGKKVLSQTGTIGNNALTFSTAKVKAGIYFVNIQSVNGNLTQKVVIK